MRPNDLIITLTPARQESLMKLAIHHGTLSRGGPLSGKPSWRALVCAIADGTLAVCQPKRQPKKITQ